MNLLQPHNSTRRPSAPDTGGNPDDWFALNDWIGLDRPSQRDDVVKVEALLANAGDYSLKRNQGQTGYWGPPQDAALRSYQARNNLAVDGRLRPGGPTIEKLRSQLAGTMAGFRAPTAVEIDTHHKRLSAGDAGLVAWGPPPMSLAPRDDLPEIGGDVHSSNARWIAAMDRSKDFSTYPDLFARSIAEHGDSAVAEVRDLIGQYDALHPGDGAKLTGEIVAALPDAATRRALLGTDAPEPQPVGSVQVAQAQAIPLLLQRGAATLGSMLGGAIAKQATDEIAKPVPPTPAPAPAPASPPPLMPQDPIPPLSGRQPAEPGPTAFPGPRLTDQERATKLEHIPVLPQEQRDAVAEKLGATIVEMQYGDRPDNRGTGATLEGNNIVARECKASIGASRLADILEHKGGASLDGEKIDYRAETEIDVGDGRRRRSDYAMGPENSRDPDKYSHINTASQHADGSLTGREQRAYDDIAKKLGEDFVKTVPKFKAGDDPEAYAKQVRAVCDELVRAQEDRLLGPAESDPTETGQ